MFLSNQHNATFATQTSTTRNAITTMHTSFISDKRVLSAPVFIIKKKNQQASNISSFEPMAHLAPVLEALIPLTLAGFLTAHTIMHNRGYNFHALVPAVCGLKHGLWKWSSVSSPCTTKHPLTGLRCVSCAVHDPWKCVYQDIESKATPFCGLVVWYCSNTTPWSSWLYRW